MSGHTPISERLRERDDDDTIEAADTIDDLLEALKECRAALWAIEDSAVEAGFDKLGDIIADRLTKANEAIAKAEGR